MQLISPSGDVYQAGTLSGNPIAVIAGITTLKILKKENPYKKLNEKSKNITNFLKSCAKDKGIPIQTCFSGGMIGFFFSENNVCNYSESLAWDKSIFKTFFHKVLKEGVYLAPSPFESLFISTAHSDSDIEFTAEAFKKGIDAI